MKKQNGIWLLFERGDEAKDNGYVFFKYLRIKHPEIKAYYVADKKNKEDYERVARYKNVIQLGSFRHKLYYLLAKKIITTHPGFCDPFPYRSFNKGIKKILFPRKYIFLQHGITKDDIRSIYGKQAAMIDLFICGAKPEYEYVLNNFGYRKNEVKYTGFARFDLLYKRKEKNEILLMPTWRRGFFVSKHGTGNDRDNFINSKFYRAYQSLINNQELITLLEKNDYRLIFYPHYEMQQFLDCFTTKSERIVFADKERYSVQELLKESKLLITDYSSVAMDFAYMEKPLIYYQFDKDEFRRMHMKEGYFSYERDGFGPVVEQESEVIDALCKYLSNDMKNEQCYMEKINNFFTIRDRYNCKRIFHSIANLK
jgi:CDP-glycerol glycerophosphotransferase (TagB/SpsB family)